MSRPTDHASLDLAQLHLDVCFGRAGGKVIWQPRIQAWYSDRMFSGEGLPGKYKGMTPLQLYRNLGCADRLYHFNACFRSREDDRVRATKREVNDLEYEQVIETPVGKQVAVFRKSENSPWHRPVKWPIADEDEMKVAAWREERRTWFWDQVRYDALRAEFAGLGAPTMYICRTTVQQLIVTDMGPENTIFALADYPATCERFFEALNLQQERLIDVLNASPIKIINFGDNIHDSILSPRLFEKYVLPVYQRRNELLHKHGKFTHAHWDGNCKSILRYARETGLDGIEAITPKPQGDVTLEETKAALGDMYLLDGIPAVLFDPTYSEQELIDCAKKCIDLFAPHLVLGISDEIASNGDIERVRTVLRVVDDYNASL
jgi:hypothetical protein